LTQHVLQVLEHPLFHDGKSPGRLLGERAKYDFFMSYRVAATVDADLLAGVWKLLTERGYQVFWDKQELHKGREWEKEFCEGLVCSHVFVPLLSQAATKNPKNERANFEKLREDSDCDNVLLEYRLALELKDRGYVKSILPLLIGQCNDGVFDRFSFAQLPSESPKVAVRALEMKLVEHLNNHCLGTPYESHHPYPSIFITHQHHCCIHLTLHQLFRAGDCRGCFQEDHRVSGAQSGGTEGESNFGCGG